VSEKIVRTVDFLVIGAGVIGLAIAIELKKIRPKAKIMVLDKETSLAFHSSGRNSGVLHAGFYYTADSLKAKFTKAGNLYWRDYCKVLGLRLNNCGKLVVSKNESELNSLNELFRRARLNQVEFHEIDEREAKKIEPRVKTYKKAGWSPSTSTVDPVEVMTAMAREAQRLGIEIELSTAFEDSVRGNVKTNRGTISVGYLINAAGLYADRIAQKMGFSKNYRILPFKGVYLYCEDNDMPLRTHIYPVPNLKNPFLGVHHTITVGGQSKIGPTAIPAFWREQYDGFSRFKINEAVSILTDEVKLFVSGGFDFRSLALQEFKKYYRKNLVSEAMLMAEGVELRNYHKWGSPGIRAQLLNIVTKKLEMDFILEKNATSLHILNAVSPAFTCAQPFAKYICEQIFDSSNISRTIEPAGLQPRT
jgi:(S)-2-hydroxyglutarate dehydrogenase